MKSNFIRLLTAMTLATSISAFARPGDAASDDKKSSKPETTPSTSSPNAGVAGQDQEQPDPNQEKARKQLIEEENKQWLHDLQGIYGG